VADSDLPAGRRSAAESSSERLASEILEAIADPVVAFDRQYRYTYVSRRAAAVLGKSAEELLGRSMWEVFPADVRTGFEDACELAWKSGTSVTVERYSRVLGQWVESYVYPFADGAATQWRDITARKGAEAALRESDERFRTLADNVSQFAWMADPEGSIFWYNRRWYDYTGTTPDKMRGWGWRAVHHPAHLGRVETLFRRHIESGEPWEDTFPLRGRDGQYRWFLSRALPIRDSSGGVVRWFGTNTDVTELRETQERARARAAELEALMEAVPIGIIIARDPECREVFGNRLAYEMHRRPYGSNLSLAPPGSDAPAPYRLRREGADLPLSELPIRRAALTGEPVRNYELDLVLEDGTSYTLLGHAVPLFNLDGVPFGAVFAFLDVTERKRHDERMRQVQKLESLGLLAGGIAHDFNNLLTGIMGNASMIVDEVPASAAEMLNEVISSAERAAHLTRQLLAYSGKGQFVVRELDVSAAVQEIANLVQFSIPKSVELSVTVQRRLPCVRMDPSQFQQILMNLVINAGEAIGDGNPGRVTVATSMTDVEQPFLDSSGQEVAPGRYLAIEISDSGVGIDPAQIGKIFEPFFTTKFTGRGLGLAAVAGIVRAQKGGITVESAPGSGSRFRVLLPASKGPGAASRPLEAPVAGSARILVVDDESAVRDFIGAVLRRHGYQVLTAFDGRDALSVFEREGGNIDAIVLDVVMPVMGANDLLPKIKAACPGLKVLLTSGYSESEARRLCADFPGATFIQKPYTAQQIFRAVEEILGRPA
jgi:PAS domain S-box-containing protein